MTYDCEKCGGDLTECGGPPCKCKDDPRKKADYEACWAGKFVYCCREHLDKLLRLGQVMGIPVDHKIHNGNELCSNCENERKKNKS